LRFARILGPFGARCFLKGRFPAVRCMDFVDFGTDVGQGLQEKLSNVGECQSVAARDAVFGDQAEELAEDMVNVAGGLEVAGKRSQASGNFFGRKDLTFVARVKQAEGGVMGGDGHTAGAAVAEWKLTKTVAGGPLGERERLSGLRCGGAESGVGGTAACAFHTN